MKKIILLLLAIAICCSFISCAELVSEEIVEVDAVITRVRHRAGSSNPPRASDNDIYFEYDGIKGSWDVDRKTYNAYKGKEGQPIKCYLITRAYDNGTTRQKLVAVDDYEGR